MATDAFPGLGVALKSNVNVTEALRGAGNPSALAAGSPARKPSRRARSPSPGPYPNPNRNVIVTGMASRSWILDRGT